jgi:hypothetical protein
MSSHVELIRAHMRRIVLLVAVLAPFGGPAPGAEPKPGETGAVVPSAPPSARREATPASKVSGAEAAFHACSQRADLLFVRKCVQGCMIDSKTSSRVMQQSREREECQLRCGHQPEMAAFIQGCLQRAARVQPARPRPAARM